MVEARTSTLGRSGEGGVFHLFELVEIHKVDSKRLKGREHLFRNVKYHKPFMFFHQGQ